MALILRSDGDCIDIDVADLALPGEFQMPVHPISDRQFAQGLAVFGLITEDEAEAWVGPGVVPPDLLTLVQSLPEVDRFSARMLLRGATTFERSHPLVETLASSYGWSSSQTDDFWRACATL